MKARGVASTTDRDDLAPEGSAQLAMYIFMASWTLSFVALLASYLYLRLNAPVWPPDGAPRPPLVLTGISTVAAVTSSLTLQSGLSRLMAGRRKDLVPALMLTLALGVFFLVVQVVAGRTALAQGLRPDLNAYAALFWVTAIFHALHVVVGLVALGVLLARARRGVLTPDRATSLQLWTTYWHGVDIVWVLIFVVMFVPG